MEEQEEQGKKESTVLPEPTEITVKNPRIGKVRKLEEEVKRQNELEQLRTRRIRKEQEYIEQMSKAVKTTCAIPKRSSGITKSLNA